MGSEEWGGLKIFGYGILKVYFYYILLILGSRIRKLCLKDGEYNNMNCCSNMIFRRVKKSRLIKSI